MSTTDQPKPPHKRGFWFLILRLLLGVIFAIIYFMINKNNIIKLATLAGVAIIIGVYVWTSRPGAEVEPQLVESPSQTPEVSPTPTPRPIASSVPLPTGDGRTTFIDESVPWHLLLADASCELKGELKFLNHNTYDNQDALFTYKGIDNPGRNVFWTVTPQDDISVGPNILNKVPLPNGESLLGVVLPESPKSKTYEITAKIQYGRLVDANGKFVTAGGTVKLFEKQCDGKTVVVLP